MTITDLSLSLSLLSFFFLSFSLPLSSAGIGRTGVFCALAVAIERIKVEHLVNIFSIVKHLRTQRAHMVQTPVCQTM